MPNSLEDHQRRMKLRRAIEQQEREFLTNAELHAALLVLLRIARKQGRLKPADRNEILHAPTQFANGNYNPGSKIRQLLRDTLLDQEEKRETPGQS